jgi:hypothetical protein
MTENYKLKKIVNTDQNLELTKEICELKWKLINEVQRYQLQCESDSQVYF